MFPKPAKGERRAEQLARTGHEKYVEKQARDASKRRDGMRCRRPGCVTKPSQWRLESAHLEDEGMGGRHSVGCERRQYVTVCLLCHQGPRSLHKGELRVTPVDKAAGADGLLLWEELTESGWVAIGIN